jgi:hypothetical protein
LDNAHEARRCAGLADNSQAVSAATKGRKMSRRFLQPAIGVTLVMLLVVGCGGVPAATPVAQVPATTSTSVQVATSISVPSIATPIRPTPTPMAPTSTPPIPTETPDVVEPSPTETLTPVPSKTPTATPTPAMETLAATRESVSQFASAMQKAGINTTAEMILQQGLQIHAITGADSRQYEIAFAHLDPDPSQQGEALEGDYPLMIKTSGRWKELGREVVQISGLDSFGTLIEYREKRSEYDTLDKTYGRYFTLGVATYLWKDQHPEPNKYNNAWPDWQISRAKDVGISKLRLHALIWGERSSSYLDFSRDKLIAETERTIETQMKHFAQLGVGEFVVVNESAYEGSGRDDIFYRIVGSDYVKLAFSKARNTNGQAILIYNDFQNQYSYTPQGKHTKDVVEMLKADDLIDGVGVQMHLKARDGIDYENITETLA